MTMRNFAAAADALEKAVELENGQVAQTLVDLALAILSRDNTPREGRTRELIDSALALEPTNQAALFYSGVAAANSGDTDTAATHFETLLGLNPPEEIRAILEDRVALWRGEMPSTMDMANHPEISAEAAVSDAIISAQVSLSSEAMAAVTVDANVFLIARDPNAPSPPLMRSPWWPVASCPGLRKLRCLRGSRCRAVRPRLPATGSAQESCARRKVTW
jgi:cytochrome c-type biogenesis protein CcmH